MRVALAGVGDLGRYLVEELTKAGHVVVVLTRSHKDFLGHVDQRITDYSVSQLTSHLQDCDALVSTITSAAPEYESVHLALIEACRLSLGCKRFIPSGWGGNIEEVPDQPIYAADPLQTIVKALRSQNRVKWTVFCPGWLVDYILPANQRHLRDLGDCWVQNYNTKTFTLYGLGSQKIDFTSARDLAKSVAILIKEDANTWDEYTSVSGAQLTWFELWQFIKHHEPEYTLKRKSLAQSITQLNQPENDDAFTVALYEIMGHSEALHFPLEKVAAQRERHFQGVKFRTPSEVYNDAIQHPNTVI